MPWERARESSRHRGSREDRHPTGRRPRARATGGPGPDRCLWHLRHRHPHPGRQLIRAALAAISSARTTMPNPAPGASRSPSACGGPNGPAPRTATRPSCGWLPGMLTELAATRLPFQYLVMDTHYTAGWFTRLAGRLGICWVGTLPPKTTVIWRGRRQPVAELAGGCAWPGGRGLGCARPRSRSPHPSAARCGWS